MKRSFVPRTGTRKIYEAGWRGGMDDAVKMLDDHGHKEAACVVLAYARGILMDGPVPELGAKEH